jgi:hypothetical protein
MPKKIAVVMTHGMGEQVPMQTLRGFVRAAWVTNIVAQWSHTPAGENPADIWFMPDPQTGSLELRRITTRWTEKPGAADLQGPRVDFFEFYWADLAEGTTVQEVWDWLRTLLFPPGGVPDALKSAWRLLWAATILVTLLSLATFWPWKQAWVHAVFAAAAAGVAYVMQRIVSPYIGDVARYVRADPRNIAMRRAIRERGLKLFGDLHASGEYERIIVVAHSLGSIVAYDLISMFWASRTDALTLHEAEPVFRRLRAVELAAHALDGADTADRPARLNAYRDAQRTLRLAMRSGGEDGTGPERTPKQEWLISDFVTLGSPLTHASFLLAHSDADLRNMQRLFLFPTDPPQFQPVQAEQRAKINNRPVPPAPDGPIFGPAGGLFSFFTGVDQTWQFHDAAAFAPVRWTNIYDPHHRVFRGDIISGPLAGVFGSGIRDISLQDLRGPSPRFSHTLYWTPTGDDPNNWHIHALRNAIDLMDTPESTRW